MKLCFEWTFSSAYSCIFVQKRLLIPNHLLEIFSFLKVWWQVRVIIWIIMLILLSRLKNIWNSLCYDSIDYLIFNYLLKLWQRLSDERMLRMLGLLLYDEESCFCGFARMISRDDIFHYIYFVTKFSVGRRNVDGRKLCGNRFGDIHQWVWGMFMVDESSRRKAFLSNGEGRYAEGNWYIICLTTLVTR